MELQKIDSNIRMIAKAGKKLDAFIHETACAIIEHASLYGDCSRALELVKAMPASARRGALINWFAAFSPIYVKFNDGKVSLRRADSAYYKPFDLDGARSNPFFTWEREVIKDVIDFSKLESKVTSLAKWIETQAKEGHIKPEDIGRALELAADLKARHVA